MNYNLKISDKASYELLRNIDYKILAKMIPFLSLESINNILNNMTRATRRLTLADVESLGEINLKESYDALKQAQSILLKLYNQGVLLMSDLHEDPVKESPIDGVKTIPLFVHYLQWNSNKKSIASLSYLLQNHSKYSLQYRIEKGVFKKVYLVDEEKGTEYKLYKGCFIISFNHVIHVSNHIDDFLSELSNRPELSNKDKHG